MAHDEPTFRRHGGNDPLDESAPHRTNPFSAADPDPRSNGVPVTPGTDGRTTSGRDRLGIHLVWEFILLLGVAAVGYLLYRLDPASLKSTALDSLLLSGTAIGVLTLGAGLSVRAGVPNLAVGPIAIASALHFAENGDRGVIEATLPAVVIATVCGLAVALVVVVFHVPGWAGTLAGALGVIVFNQLRATPVVVQGRFDPSDKALMLFSGFTVLALLGGGLGAVPAIRRTLGALRPVGDPAERRGALTAVSVIAALVVSSVLAVCAGVLLAANSATAIVPGTGLEWTGLAVGLALVAGTSAFGRRGGVFGTLLAVAGMALFLDYAERRNFNIALFATAACTLVAGLVVTRLIETYGRPTPVDGAGEDWQPATTGESWLPDSPQTWSPAMPAQGASNGWLDDRWGQLPR